MYFEDGEAVGNVVHLAEGKRYTIELYFTEDYDALTQAYKYDDNAIKIICRGFIVSNGMRMINVDTIYAEIPGI